jgi:heme A synthase
VAKSPSISPALAGLAVLTTVLTWFLIILGGVVHGTGSSLACPDWPTCHGTLMPEMVGGVAIEHSHRLLASTVGFLSILLVIFSWGHKGLRHLSLFALGLVIFQGVLGGITVLLKLPPAVSIGHLATSMAFLALMVWISAMAVAGVKNHSDLSSKNSPQGTGTWVLVAMLATYLQLVLGGMVRHLGAGLACMDIPLCEGSLWPSGATPTLQIHMAHRIGAIVVTGVVLFAALRVLFRGPPLPLVRFLAGNLVFLVLIQVAFGLLSVVSALQLFPVTAHLAVGALLWVNLVLLYFVLSGGRGRTGEAVSS